MELPDDILEKLKCSICKEYLSHPPFYYNPRIGSICGRHPRHLTHGHRMQPIMEKNYEILAGFILFSCRNKINGCTEKFTVKQMPVHEKFCNFQFYLCPIRGCAWQGPNQELTLHFFLYHKSLVLIDNCFNIKFMIQKNFKKNFYLTAFNQFFMIPCVFQNNTFHCCIHLIRSQNEIPPNFEYEIFLESQDDQTSWCIAKFLVQQNYNKCARNEECGLSISTSNILSDKPFTFILRVKFLNVVQFEEESTKIGNDGILEVIRCPICFKFMVPPFFQCVLGHSFCVSCTSKSKNCPTCNQLGISTSNFSLQKVTDNVTYSCSFLKDGCSFKSNFTNVKKHELECEYRTIPCILNEVTNCKQVGPLIKMYQHCVNVHPNNIQKGAYCQIKYEPDCLNAETTRVQYNFGLLFKIKYAYNKEVVKCSVQCINPRKDNAIFMYDIEVVDMNNTRMELISKKLCGNLDNDENDMERYTIWYMDMVKPFVSTENSILKFKCIIFEEN